MLQREERGVFNSREKRERKKVRQQVLGTEETNHGIMSAKSAGLQGHSVAHSRRVQTYQRHGLGHKTLVY